MGSRAWAFIFFGIQPLKGIRILQYSIGVTIGVTIEVILGLYRVTIRGYIGVIKGSV